MAEKLSENVSLPDESAEARRISASERCFARKGLSSLALSVSV